MASGWVLVYHDTIITMHMIQGIYKTAWSPPRGVAGCNKSFYTIQGICQVLYTVKSRFITFTENYAVLSSSVFYRDIQVRLPSESTIMMALVYYILETP